MTRPLDPLAFPLHGSRLIEASAGTGKTWTIAALYLRLVLGHGEDGAAFARPLAPQEILVMTFTRAATRELSERIRSRLVEAARGFRDPRTIETDDALVRGLVASYADDAAREAAAWRLAMAAEAMDDAAVFTIDAWVQRMLREHAFDSGSLFDEELQADEAAMLVEAAHDYWRQEVYPLDRAAIDGITNVWADVTKLAADVRMLTRYIDAAADGGPSLGALWQAANSEHAAAVAQVKSGWPARVDEMRTWVNTQIALPSKPINGTRLQQKRTNDWLDKVALWLVGADEADFPLSGDATRRLSRDGLLEAVKPGHEIEIPSVFDDLQAMVAAFRLLKGPAEALRRHAAAGVAARLQRLKRRAGAFGFQDMLERLDRALAGPSGHRLRERIVTQYPVALIDEFQDTSPLQYRIFDGLYRVDADDPATALLLIGDPKQSIYGFRGADIRSYLQARTSTTGRHYLLTTNWRSTEGLVEAVNHLFAGAEARTGSAFRFPRVDGASEGPLPFHPVDAHGRGEVLHDANGPVAALTLSHDASLTSKRDAMLRFAEHAAEHIARSLADARSGFVDAAGRFVRLKPADITVLVRDRKEAAAIRHALQRRRIPSVFLSDQESVFASEEAGDLLHWLRAVADPMDTRRARVGFATALVGLPLPALAALSHDDVAFEARIDELKLLHGEWRRQGVLPMLRRSLHLLDLPARWLAQADGERRLTNVLHLAELLQAASAHLDGEQALIRWLADQLEVEGRGADEQIVRLESDADLVKVVTIHKAKGLEYPVVYLPFACAFHGAKKNAGEVAFLADDDGERRVVFDPDEEDRVRVQLERQQEDLRLLYVALTRARHALWLGVAALKDGSGRQCAFEKSAFGYLVVGEEVIAEGEIAGRLQAAFAGLSSVALVPLEPSAERTRLVPTTSRPPLVERPDYAASFERDWSIGSFSGFVRDLVHLPIAAALVAPAVEEELLSGPAEENEGRIDGAIASSAARHRFPRGALAGNFLHDQLEWLATHRFALATEPHLGDQLARRCERQGWGNRAADVVTWLTEVVTTPLPPIGLALDTLPRIVPEMEFWFPSEGIDAARMDRLCREHLLDGRERPALPDRRLRGMLMGFADLVFEADGRYWVLDYKSNALGARDADYTADALAASMAQHRYDVQSAIYLLALHRLLRQRLGARYDPARHLGGALYLFLRGIEGPVSGCHVVAPSIALLDALDAALGASLDSGEVMS